MDAIMYKGKNSDKAAARRSSCLFDFLAVGQCSPIQSSPELMRDGDPVLR